MIGINTRTFTQNERAEQIALENLWLGYFNLSHMPEDAYFVVQHGQLAGIGWLSDDWGDRSLAVLNPGSRLLDGADYDVAIAQVDFIQGNYSSSQLPRQYYRIN
ncbi:MAG: hypothetical protein F6K65_22280 [Moorea sp. SIO3C2]|nr:hypothetical protein [Moorena sp. SIO3C2]